MWNGPFTGLIRVGDKFTWAPYGHDGWPRAWARIEVTDIVRKADGEVLIAAAQYRNGEIAGDESDDTWNDEGHFREMVGEHDPVINRTEYPVSDLTTENPRSPAPAAAPTGKPNCLPT